MTLRLVYRTASAVATLAAIGIFAVRIAAQNPGSSTEGPVSGFGQAAATFQNLPAWAYPPSAMGGRGGAGRGGRGLGGGGTPPGGTPIAASGRGRGGAPPDDGTLKHVPGSNAGYTLSQIRNMYDIPDWFPDGHPPMPDIVSHGDKERSAGGCGYCHLPNGYGRTENQSIAGLPVEYIIQQVSDIKSGLRRTSGPRLSPASTMVKEAQNATEEEVKVAAAYFASIKPKPWIRVEESDTVPKTKVSGAIYQLEDGGDTEPIGERIVELAEDQDRFELRDASSGFVAYAPTGSIKKGKELVTKGGGGETIPCTICHGSDLKGIGNVPSIVGRSPSQMARQIVDIQNGNRNGPWASLMKEPVRKLTNNDIVAITAYLASQAP